MVVLPTSKTLFQNEYLTRKYSLEDGTCSSERVQLAISMVEKVLLYFRELQVLSASFFLLLLEYLSMWRCLLSRIELLSLYIRFSRAARLFFSSVIKPHLLVICLLPFNL